MFSCKRNNQMIIFKFTYSLFLIFQKYTCKLLEDTVKCDELLSRCHSAEEVKRMKDAHIAARINQYDDNKV